MILEKRLVVVNVVDAGEDLLKVAESELFFLKLYYNIDVLLGQRTVTVTIFVELFHDLL